MTLGVPQGSILGPPQDSHTVTSADYGTQQSIFYLFVNFILFFTTLLFMSSYDFLKFFIYNISLFFVCFFVLFCFVFCLVSMPSSLTQSTSNCLVVERCLTNKFALSCLARMPFRKTLYRFQCCCLANYPNYGKHLLSTC